MKIRIYDVGRNKMESTIEVNDDCDRDWVAAAIHKEVKRMKAMMSRGVEVTWDPFHGRGAVYAGGRAVGSAEVVS